MALATWLEATRRAAPWYAAWMELPSIKDIRDAARRIERHAHRTPVLRCGQLDDLAGRALFFKCENLQKVGAFKFRGALNAVLSLTDQEAATGVCTHSSGNHAAALALAARIRGIPAHVVMPGGSPACKREAVLGYGARIVECDPTLEARERTLEDLRRTTGASFVHPYDDPRVIAGQGTVALELHAQVPDLDTLCMPVGGGGLMSGSALASAAVAPNTRVVAAEPERANDAWRSKKAGHLIPVGQTDTLADGLRTSLSPRTFRVLRDHVAEVVTVSEAAIIRAMRLVWERMKILIEASSAVAVAAALDGRLAGERLGIVLTGGNVDLDRLPW